jgi:hypothetical protein
MKGIFTFYILLLISFCSYSQGIGIGTATPDASAALDITANNKGLLIPRMNAASMNAINNPARGLMIYDSISNQLMVNIGTPAAPNWQAVASNGNGNAWNLAGNGNVDPSNNFIGTTNNQPLRFRINNIQAGELHPETGNIFWGLRAGAANTSGFSNVAIGTDALKFDIEGANLVAIGDSALFNNGKNNPVPGALAVSNTAIGSKSLFSNTLGAGNTATGTRSLFSNTDGSANTAYGVGSLFSNTRGGLNTAVGSGALRANTTGNENTATGWESLSSNTTGVFNSAFGSVSLENNTIGDNNTATGFASLNFNTTGNDNTATGIRSLFSNTTGSSNTAVGSHSLFTNTIGSENTAAGREALFFNTIGTGNTATGFQSLFSNTGGGFNTAYGAVALRANTEGHGNTASGHKSLFTNTTGSDNSAFGSQSLFTNATGNRNTAAGSESLFSNTTGDDNVAIGWRSLFSNTIGLGNTATGEGSLSANTTGGVNTAIGNLALGNSTVGNNNTAVGTQALFLNLTGSSNTAVGNNALSATTGSSKNTVVGFNAAFSFNMGSNNTIIGADADANQNGLTNATAIGAGAIVNASNKIRIGNGAVTVIEGQVPFTTPSDGRFKYQVKEDVKGLDFIMQLRPVTYQFDVKRFDEEQMNDKSTIASSYIMQASYNEAAAIRRTGFIAQEVENAANASGYNFSGIIKPKTSQDHYSLSYESFVVPLVKAVQEQQQLIAGLKKQNEELRKNNADQKKIIDNVLQRLGQLELPGAKK